MAAQSAKPSAAIAQKNASPPAPQASVSLADQPPTAAAVTFHNGQLSVEAHNSTLLQILQEITAQTGMKVQGAPGNHRIFGVYGPGTPRAVLAELLSGFGFNYLLVGTAHNGAPQTLILASTPGSMPAPPQPVQSIQPAPQNTLPQPQPGPRPAYEPQRGQSPTRMNMPPHGVPNPQQILKELEAMHARQQGSSR